MAFLKSPIGQMFHQFFGENMLRADVCNAVEELGQLLDHTGPVAKSERNAARIFNADHCYFVTNGTSTSNKMVWHSTVAPGDIVVVDRNCHKSILHSIIMCGAIPVFLMPTRNHLGIIGPIPLEEFTPESIAPQDRSQSVRARSQEQEAAHPDHHPVDLRRRGLQRRDPARNAGRQDRHPALRRSLAAARHLPRLLQEHARDRPDRPRAKESMIFSTQSTHKLLAGLSQASQVLVRESETVKLDQDAFNEAYLMHTSTSPQYSIIASCDVAAAMMEAPGGTALVEESIFEALDFRRAMKKVDEEWGKDWWFKVWGPDNFCEEGIGTQDDWMIRAEDDWHGFGKLAPGFNMLDPIKATVVTPGLSLDGKFGETGIPASIVTKYLAEHGVIIEKCGLYSFFIMFTIGITKGRWNTLVTALQQFKDDYDKNQPMWRILPEFAAANPRYEAMGLRDLCQQIHDFYKAVRRGAPDDRDVSVGHDPGDEAVGRLCQDGAPRDRARGDRGAGRPHHRDPADALPAGHSAADPGRALQQDHRRLPALRARLQRALPGLRDRRARAGQARGRRQARLLRRLRAAGLRQDRWRLGC